MDNLDEDEIGKLYKTEISDLGMEETPFHYIKTRGHYGSDKSTPLLTNLSGVEHAVHFLKNGMVWDHGFQRIN